MVTAAALRAYVQAVAPVSAADWALLAAIAVPATYPKNGFLQVPGQVCGAVAFVAKGLFRLYYPDASGHEVNARFAAENEFIVDYHSFLSQQPGRYACQALEPAEVLLLPYAGVQRLYRQSAAWDHFGRLMAEQVYRQVMERVEALQFLSPEQRYAQVLAARPPWLARISQAQLASYLGVQPESLSRIRHRLGFK